MRSVVLAWPPAVKRLVVIGVDLALGLVSTWIAFSLRLDTFHVPEQFQWRVYLIAPCLAVPVFIKFGLYRAIFRYTGQAALIATAKAIAVYSVLLMGILLWQEWPGVPRSLGILQPLIFLLLVGSSRAIARFWLAGLHSARNKSINRLLIFGAGIAGAQTAAALAVSRQYDLLGYVDDDPIKVGRSINGLTVFSSMYLNDLVRNSQITDILLAMPGASRERRNQIIQSLSDLPVHVRTLPSLGDLASGRVSVQDFKELDIEDLLGREPVAANTDLLASSLKGQVVLVTGAAGSIGSELARQIVMQQPSRLVLLDHSEYGLYSIQNELQTLCLDKGLSIELLAVLGSVKDKERCRSICQTWQPVVIFHAAAYKHVPMVEDNPGEGVLNNIMGTLNMANAAAEFNVPRFVLVSTDKAVRPTNVMGATKRMAELVLQALAEKNSATTFSMVRFGNVLGSSGSVVPLFRKQLAAGGPLTVTHPDVTRYFMTIPEAAQLVLLAGAMGQGGDVFVLDMGEPIKIMDLARRMVALSGLTLRDPDHPDGDIQIDVTGLRPGEKLYEELLIGNNPEPTAHPRIMKAHEAFLPWSELQTQLETIKRAAEQGDVQTIKAVLRECVQGYGEREK
jgi:FlaA1/EpsC-like NDP-sugar epimerase